MTSPITTSSLHLFICTVKSVGINSLPFVGPDATRLDYTLCNPVSICVNFLALKY